MIIRGFGIDDSQRYILCLGKTSAWAFFLSPWAVGYARAVEERQAPIDRKTRFHPNPSFLRYLHTLLQNQKKSPRPGEALGSLGSRGPWPGSELVEEALEVGPGHRHADARVAVERGLVHLGEVGHGHAADVLFEELLVVLVDDDEDAHGGGVLVELLGQQAAALEVLDVVGDVGHGLLAELLAGLLALGRGQELFHQHLPERVDAVGVEQQLDVELLAEGGVGAIDEAGALAAQADGLAEALGDDQVLVLDHPVVEGVVLVVVQATVGAVPDDHGPVVAQGLDQRQELLVVELVAHGVVGVADEDARAPELVEVVEQPLEVVVEGIGDLVDFHDVGIGSPVELRHEIARDVQHVGGQAQRVHAAVGDEDVVRRDLAREVVFHDGLPKAQDPLVGRIDLHQVRVEVDQRDDLAQVDVDHRVDAPVQVQVLLPGLLAHALELLADAHDGRVFRAACFCLHVVKWLVGFVLSIAIISKKAHSMTN